MLGKIKWILFTVLIISLVITGMLFINFNTEKKNIVNSIENIFDKHWYKINTQIYEDDVLAHDVGNYIEGYIVFGEEKVKYCLNNMCDEYDYTYDSTSIDMPIDKYVLKGKYNIKYDDENLDFIYENEGYKTIYHFETAKG